MLTVRNVSKTYANGVRALRDVTLDIPNGMFGLLGPNGAGKSTLMNTIATLLECDAGTIFLDELDVLNEKQEVRKALGYLPQEFGVYPRVPAETLLEHLAVLKGITGRRERRDVVEHLLRLTNLWDVRRRRLGGFSGGMRQRFGIAQALLGSPKLIIVDEPTAGLDPEERQRFLNFLSDIGEDVVVVLSTHIVEDVAEVCTSMAIIAEGEVRLTGDPRALIDRMAGKIWRKAVHKRDVPAYRESTAVISTRLFAGNTILHVYGDADPGDGFEQVLPDLADVYFATLTGAR